MSETPVFTGAGSTFSYAAATAAWTPLDEGLSGTYIYYNQDLKLYRVIAIAQASQKFVINSTLQVGTAFQRNNDQFISWVDPFGVFGINFSSKQQADDFISWFEKITKPPAVPAPAPVATTSTTAVATTDSTTAVPESAGSKPADPVAPSDPRPTESVSPTPVPADPPSTEAAPVAVDSKPAEAVTPAPLPIATEKPTEATTIPAGLEPGSTTTSVASSASSLPNSHSSVSPPTESAPPKEPVAPSAASVLTITAAAATTPATSGVTATTSASNLAGGRALPQTPRGTGASSTPRAPKEAPPSVMAAVTPRAPVASATPRARSTTNTIAPVPPMPSAVVSSGPSVAPVPNSTPHRAAASMSFGLPPPIDLPPPPDVPPPAPPAMADLPPPSHHHHKKDKKEKKEKKEEKDKDKKEKDKKKGSERRHTTSSTLAPGSSVARTASTESPSSGSPSNSSLNRRADDDSSASTSYIKSRTSTDTSHHDESSETGSGPDVRLPSIPPRTSGSAIQGDNSARGGGDSAPSTPSGKERPSSVRHSVLMTPRSSPPVAAAPTPGLPPLPVSGGSQIDLFGGGGSQLGGRSMNRITSMFFGPPPSLGGSSAPASPARNAFAKLAAPENLEVRDLLADNATANERDMAIKELYNSETSYLQNIDRINALHEKVLQDIKEKGEQNAPFTRDSAAAIFLNIKNIKFLNTKLAANLKSRLQQWNDRKTISDVFLELLPYFKEYRTFCSGYDGAAQALMNAMKKKETAAYLQELEKALLEKGKTLMYLLVLPTQRLPRYVQSLEGILKWTPPDHPDSFPCRQLIEKLHEFYSDLNEHIRRTENIKKTKAQAGNKNFSPSLQGVFIEGRLLVHEDEKITSVKFATANARNNPPAVHVLIFSDVLVFGQRVTDKKHKLEPHCSIPLEFAWLDLARVTEKEVVLLTIVEGMITIEFAQPADKTLFIRMFNDTLIRHLRAKNIRSPKDDVMLQRYLTVRPEDGVEIEGFFEYAKLHGEASMRWKSGASYVGGWEEGKMQGKGRFTYKTGETLEGMWRDNAPHGRAKLSTPDGSYDGEWESGIRMGQGELRWKNGDTYVGQFAADLIDGKGKYTAANGQSYYDGSWKAMLRQGQGTLRCARYTYSGDWTEDRREGSGTLKAANGDDYTGQWKDDQRSGHGVFVSGDGRVRYDGEWARDKRNGKGTLTVQGEYKYEGEFRDDQRHGQAVIKFEDGSVYEGNFKEEVFEAQGKLTKPSGEVYDGQWHNGQRQGKGTLITVDGSKYVGDFYKDDRHGKGTMVDSTGSTYEGDWQYNFRHGLGTFSNGDGSIRYVGTWERDRRHGKGTQTDKLGRYEGLWKEDCWHGHGRYQYHSGVVLEGVWQNGVRHGESHIFLPGQLSEPAHVISYKQAGPLSAASSDAVLESLFLTPPPPKTYFRM